MHPCGCRWLGRELPIRCLPFSPPKLAARALGLRASSTHPRDPALTPKHRGRHHVGAPETRRTCLARLRPFWPFHRSSTAHRRRRRWPSDVAERIGGAGRDRRLPPGPGSYIALLRVYLPTYSRHARNFDVRSHHRARRICGDGCDGTVAARCKHRGERKLRIGLDTAWKLSRASSLARRDPWAIRLACISGARAQ